MGPAQIAAVIAAKFTACPPNGAASTEKIPVARNNGPGSGWKPFTLSTAMPGIFCEAIVTMNSGTATPISPA